MEKPELDMESVNDFVLSSLLLSLSRCHVTHSSGFTIVDFEQVNVDQDLRLTRKNCVSMRNLCSKF